MIATTKPKVAHRDFIRNIGLESAAVALCRAYADHYGIAYDKTDNTIRHWRGNDHSVGIFRDGASWCVMIREYE